MQTRTLLVLWTAKTHCQVMLSFLPAALPGPSPQGRSQSILHQSLLVLGIVPIQIQDLVLSLELHEVHTVPSLASQVKVPLDGIPSSQCVPCTTRFGVSGKLAEADLNPTVQSPTKRFNNRQHWWPQHQPLTALVTYRCCGIKCFAPTCSHYYVTIFQLRD